MNKLKILGHVKRTGVSLLFLLFCLFAIAQNGEKNDTAITLKYKLDSTIVTVEEEQAAPETDSEDPQAETTTGPEFFLRKEFTGGIFDSLRLRQLPDSVMKRFREDNAFWYANEVFKKRQPKEEQASFISHPFFQTLLWIIIIGGFAAFLILYLYNSNVGLFRRSSVIAAEETYTVTEDIFAINYQREIDKAVETGNYRLGVRLMFLRLLKKLSDKNIIHYKQDNTNLDYLMQLQPGVMYADFFRLTRNYEYCWYGQFDIDKEKYVVIKKDFDSFERKL